MSITIGLGNATPSFETFYPMGSKEAKAGKADDAIFWLYSRGLETARDAYIYNFSCEACAEHGRRMTADYLAAVEEMVQQQLSVLDEHSDLRKQFDRAVQEAVRTQPEQTEAEVICTQLLFLRDIRISGNSLTVQRRTRNVAIHQI